MLSKLMKIETGWVNDDFMHNRITIRVDDPENELMVQFKAETNKPNMTDAICNRLIILKATRRFKMLLKSGAKGRIYWREVL
jgi:hypothetical protein